jgi:hypothetical protein
MFQVCIRLVAMKLRRFDKAIILSVCMRPLWCIAKEIVAAPNRKRPNAALIAVVIDFQIPMIAVANQL